MKPHEAIARAISAYMPLEDGGHWSPKGFQEARWPKSYTLKERKYIRTVAKIAWKEAERVR